MGDWIENGKGIIHWNGGVHHGVITVQYDKEGCPSHVQLEDDRGRRYTIPWRNIAYIEWDVTKK